MFKVNRSGVFIVNFEHVITGLGHAHRRLIKTITDTDSL